MCTCYTIVRDSLEAISPLFFIGGGVIVEHNVLCGVSRVPESGVTTTWALLSCQSSSSSSEDGTLISETEDPTDPPSEAVSSMDSFDVAVVDDSLVSDMICLLRPIIDGPVE